jgi:hypothetical protein
MRPITRGGNPDHLGKEVYAAALCCGGLPALDETFRLFDHDVDIFAGDAPPRKDRRQEPTLSMPALVLTGEQVLAKLPAQLSVSGPVLAEAVRLAEDFGSQLWRRHAVERDTPSGWPSTNASQSTNFIGGTGDRAEIVATQFTH